MNISPQAILRGIDPNNTTAPLHTPIDCLRRILAELDLREQRDIAFQFEGRATLVSSYGPAGFNRNRNGEATLLALEKLFSLLEYAAPPAISIVELLKSSHSQGRRVCAGRYFRTIYVRGAGDLLIEFRSSPLLRRANALIVAHWGELSSTGARPQYHS